MHSQRVDVTKEDQTDINTFNKLNSKLQDLNRNVTVKKVGLLCHGC